MFDLKHQRLLDSLNLDYGAHKDPDSGLCAMEMVAFLAGEGHSDHPDCACPVLTGYTIRLNDAMPEHWRQQLKPYLPLVVGTRDGQEVARAELLAWHSVRVFLPMALEACQMPKQAEKFRHFKRSLKHVADAAYATYASVGNARTGLGAVNVARAVTMHTARAAYAAHCAGAARAAHLGRAMDATDAADAAIALTRVASAEVVWPLALETLDAMLAIGADERARPVTVTRRLRPSVEA